MKTRMGRMGLMGVMAMAMLAGCRAEAAFLAPSNPPPVVQLGWTASPDPTVTGYSIYYGVASGQYTNVVQVGNVTNASITLPARGVQFFFAATATASGLESPFSNEINYTAKLPPGAPGLKPPVTLVVQTKSSSSSQWADSGKDWTLSPEEQNQLFRLRIVDASASVQVTAQARALKALRATPMPPAPGT